MLYLIPVALFGILTIVITALRWRGMRMGYIWLLPASLIFIAWLAMVILPLPASPQMQEWNYLQLGGEGMSIRLVVDATSWSFLFLLISLVLVYFLTLTVRLDSEKRSVLWVAWLLLGALAMLTCTASNLVTLILLWTLIDLLDYLFSRFVFKSIDPTTSAGSFLTRMLAILLIMIAAIFGAGESGDIGGDALNIPRFVLLLIAALLHMGILPIRRPIDVDEGAGQSFDFLMRLVSLVIGLGLLARISGVILPLLLSQILIAIFWLLAILFTILGFQEKSSLNQWSKAMVCLSAMAVVAGNPASVPAWCALACVGLGMYQFYRVRTTQIGIFIWLAALAISGLPFTIGANALQGLLQVNNPIPAILSLPVYALLLLNFIEKMRAEKGSAAKVEAWYQAVYLFGLFLLNLMPFAIVVKHSTYLANAWQNWWLGVAVVVIALVGKIVDSRIDLPGRFRKRTEQLVERIRRTLTFEWLGGLYSWLTLIFQEVLLFTTQLLEGEGGIIWAIVILALMVSLVGAGAGGG